MDSTKSPLYMKDRRTSLGSNDDFEDLIDFVEKCCHHLETEINDPRMKTSPCPQILLSIHVLTQTLRANRPLRKAASAPGFAADWPSLLPLRSLCTPDRDCCTPSFNYLCEKFDHCALYYLACLCRTRISDHRACNKPGVPDCVAFNIGTGSQSLHLHADCHCDAVTAENPQEMLDLLSQGHTPLVRARRNRDTGEVELRYIRSEPTTSYVAISHLWADGMGNENDNHLHRCRLLRLLSLVILRETLANIPRRGIQRLFWERHILVGCILCPRGYRCIPSATQIRGNHANDTYLFISSACSYPR